MPKCYGALRGGGEFTMLLCNTTKLCTVQSLFCFTSGTEMSHNALVLLGFTITLLANPLIMSGVIVECHVISEGIRSSITMHYTIF